MENKQKTNKPISINFGLIQSTSFCVSISSNRTYITFFSHISEPQAKVNC